MQRRKQERGSLYCCGISALIHIGLLGIVGVVLFFGAVQAKPSNAMEIEMIEVAPSTEKEAPKGNDSAALTPSAPVFTPKTSTPKLFNQSAQSTSTDNAGVKNESAVQSGASSQGEGAPTDGSGGDSGGSSASPGNTSSGSSSSSGGGKSGGASNVDWRGRFVARVESNKSYPFQARRQGVTGLVKVSVVISDSGSLLENSVVVSSGDSRLDKAAQEAVRASVPFPHEAGGSLAMTIPIRFNLN